MRFTIEKPLGQPVHLALEYSDDGVVTLMANGRCLLFLFPEGTFGRCKMDYKELQDMGFCMSDAYRLKETSDV